MGMMDTVLATLPDDSSDTALIDRVRRGEGAAFAQIMRRNNRRLFRLVRAMIGSDIEAEEVVQETYVRAFAALATWRGDASLSTWLSRIALNEALALLQRRRETVEFAHAADAPAGPSDGAFDDLLRASPEADAARGEIRRLLERAIDELPPDFRCVFVLRAVEQLSVEETAAALQIPSETVRTRFFRARRLLRQALDSRLASVLEDAFPFAGARCDRIMEKVFARLPIASEAPAAATENRPEAMPRRD